MRRAGGRQCGIRAAVEQNCNYFTKILFVFIGKAKKIIYFVHCKEIIKMIF